MVRAIFDFCPSVSEELPLFVGDVIEVLAVVDEFWLLGKKEDVTGKRYSFHTGPSLLLPCLPSVLIHPSLWPVRRVSAIAPSLHIDSLWRLGEWTLLPQPSFLPAFLFPFPMLCLSGPVLLFPSSECTLYLSSQRLLFTIALGSSLPWVSGMEVRSTSFLFISSCSIFRSFQDSLVYYSVLPRSALGTIN